ncbi:AlpA family transcriptional regulator [Neptunomonas phycophila]|nr:AlpA family transcriptional regulator [Neptunomonas phycophila]
MTPTTQSPATYSSRQQRILRLPEVKAKTGFGHSTIYALMTNGLEPAETMLTMTVDKTSASTP